MRLVLLALTLLPALSTVASAQDPPSLRLWAPLYQSSGGSSPSFKHLVGKKPVQVEVVLTQGAGGTELHRETLVVLPRAPGTPSAPGDGVLAEADRVERATELVLGADPTNPLPPGLGEDDVWFTTQVSTLDKSGTSVAKTYLASPPQPLGVSGFTERQDLAPASVTVGLAGGGDLAIDEDGLLYAQDAVEGRVLTAVDGDGNVAWRQTPPGPGVSGTAGTFPRFMGTTTGGLAEASLTQGPGGEVVVSKPMVISEGLQVPEGAVEGAVLRSDADGSAAWEMLELPGSALGPGAVGSDELVNDAVGTQHFAEGSVTGAAIMDGRIFTQNLAPMAVGPGKIAVDTIGPDDADAFVDGIFTTDDFVDDVIDTDFLQDGAVLDIHIPDGSLDTPEFANALATSSRIDEGAVGTQALKADDLDNNTFGSGSVTSEKLPDGIVTGVEIINLSVTTEQLADESVDGDTIEDGEVNTIDLGPDAVTSEKIKNGEVKREDLADGAVTIDDLVEVDGTILSTNSGQVTHRGNIGSAVSDDEWFEITPEPEFSQTLTPGQDAVSIEVAAGAPVDMNFLTLTKNGTPDDLRFRVDVGGNAYADGDFNPGGADYADLIRVSTGAGSVSPGDVLVVDPREPRAVVLSSAAVSSQVAGVVSTRPAVLGSHRGWNVVDEQGRRRVADAADMARAYDLVPMALVGIVPCKVSDENGAIRPGDLLVTSATPGHAMRGDDPRAGTVLGKALDGWSGGRGVIPVLVKLQ